VTPASVSVRAGPLRLRCLIWGRDRDPNALLVHGNGVVPGGHHFLVARPAQVGAALRRFLDGLP
jgi:hypothetical protein